MTFKITPKQGVSINKLVKEIEDVFTNNTDTWKFTNTIEITFAFTKVVAKRKLFKHIEYQYKDESFYINNNMYDAFIEFEPGDNEDKIDVLIGKITYQLLSKLKNYIKEIALIP